MTDAGRQLVLPKGLDDVDAAFMTQVLRNSGAIGPSNEVVSQEEQGVGMTAGYFSAIKKVRCTYREATSAPATFVVKAWPPFEIAPKETIAAMFAKDIKGYQFPASRFYPRPNTHLAAFDAPDDRWVLVMDDADSFAQHKVHEHELTLDEVMKMIPGLVDVAVAWEGCDAGEAAAELSALGVGLWTSPTNLTGFKAAMPGAAKIFDKLTTMGHSTLIGQPTWDACLGGPGVCEAFTRKIDAFFEPARPDRGATCTLSHGDLRGDNIFFCEPSAAFPGGWLCIDFQLMFRGPVPSDLAYLMSTGSVLPEVYAGENLHRVLRAFYDQFMARTRLYKAYTYERFVDEYAMMTMVPYTYYLAFGAAYYQEGALNNALGMRVELGGQGVAEADLAPEETRQRMWWRKTFANFRENFRTFNLYERLGRLPENLDGLGPWTELPEHLL
jgi:hypothetical protein